MINGVRREVEVDAVAIIMHLSDALSHELAHAGVRGLDNDAKSECLYRTSRAMNLSMDELHSHLKQARETMNSDPAIMDALCTEYPDFAYLRAIL